MSTLLKALVGGVPTLINADTVARSAQTATNGTAPLTSGMVIGKSAGQTVPADAPTGVRALGYVLAAFAASAAVTYYTDGVNTGATGLTDGAEVVLGASGAATTTATEPSIGQSWQSIGKANGTTSFVFVPGVMYPRAS